MGHSEGTVRPSPHPFLSRNVPYECTCMCRRPSSSIGPQVPSHACTPLYLAFTPQCVRDLSLAVQTALPRPVVPVYALLWGPAGDQKWPAVANSGRLGAPLYTLLQAFTERSPGTAGYGVVRFWGWSLADFRLSDTCFNS